MSESQTDMDLDVDASEEAQPSPGPGVAALQVQDTTPVETSRPTGTTVVVTGGKHIKSHFGDKHYHYHVSLSTDQQPGIRPSQVLPPVIHTQSSEESDIEDRIVPPQQGQSINGENVQSLTDTLFVDMSKRLSKTSRTSKPIYPGYQILADGQPRLTAVKIFQYDKKWQKREAENLLKLSSHSNVVFVIHACILPGSLIWKQIYIVMEQCQPLTLEQYIEDRKKVNLPFNTKQALDFVKQIISGMKHIHDANVVHRDFKPSSVLFTLDGKNLKIIDFGASKKLVNGLTQMSTSIRVGADDGYRAPEAYKDITNRRMRKPADVFSLANVIYYIWSYGLHAFGEDGTLWVHNIKKGNSPDLSKLLVPNPEKAEALLRNMLKVNENERLTMPEIESHVYISKGVEQTILSEMDEVWKGPIKSVLEYTEQFQVIAGDGDGAHPFDCVLFERRGNNFLDLREKSAQLKMVYVPSTRMAALVEGLANVPPNGYVAVSKDVYLKQLKKKFGKLMAWFNASRNKDRIGSFIIFKPRGYEELVCIFIENPEEFLNRLRDVAAAETVSGSGPGPSPGHEEETSPQTLTTPLHPTADENGLADDSYASEASRNALLRAIASPEEDSEDEDIPDIPQLPSTSREVQIRQAEYISWWLYSPPIPSEGASS